MRKLRGALSSVAVLAAIGASPLVNANVVDLFTMPTDFTTNRAWDESIGAGGCTAGSTSGNGCFSEYGNSPTTILGGYRDLYAEAVSQTSGAPSSRLYAGNGLLSFNNDAGTNGYGKVQWDGMDGSADLNKTGLASADLINQTGCGTGCEKFLATVLIADQGFEYKITIFDMDGDSSTLTANTQFAVTSSTTAEYFFSWFNLANGNYFLDGLNFNITHGTNGGTTGAIDFTKVGALQLELNTAGTIAVDLQLESITKAAPEPSALALAGIALLGAGAVGIRRRRSAEKSAD